MLIISRGEKMAELRVRKKDGREEDYREENVFESMRKAGLPETDARSIALKVTEWVRERAEQGAVATSEIKDRVVEQVREVNEEVSERFRNFVKSST